MRFHRTNKKGDPGEEIPNEEIVAGFLASPWNHNGMRLARALNGYLNAPKESHGLGLGWDPGDPDFDRIEAAILAARSEKRAASA
ncbi:MAG TPA: hypothetical protein VGP90_09845 [Acidimicrobiia bacterium]|jgi:hypothetical protein|nr:hypothetical protein [Acidimicrobiia bacterium]